MADISKPYSMITDFVTDNQVPNVGAEENRQVVEKLLVEQKGYLKDYKRIKGGKKFNIHFDNYSEEYVTEMINYFEANGDYEKSGYLNLRLNGFKEHK